MTVLKPDARQLIPTFSLMLALMPLAAAAEGGFYIGGSAGGANTQADLNDVSLSGLPSSVDEDDTGTKFFGGYTFELPNVDIAIEAGYVDFGEPDIDVLGNDLLLDTSGINVWGIASFDAGPINIFGKLGLINWEVDAEYLGASSSVDGTDLGYGIGASYDFNPVQIRAEFELYNAGDTDLSMLSLGVVYKFQP